MREKLVLRKKGCDATKGRETETKTLSVGNTDEFVLYLVMLKQKAGRSNKLGPITVDNAGGDRDMCRDEGSLNLNLKHIVSFTHTFG